MSEPSAAADATGDRALSANQAFVQAWTAIGAGDLDIMELAFVAMMEATKSAQEDLKQIMAGVNAVNAAKAQLRDIIAKVNRDVVACTAAELQGQAVRFASDGLGGEEAYHRAAWPIPDAETLKGITVVPVDLHPDQIARSEDLRAVADDLAAKLDSMSEMSEMTSLRLQMAMDRRSKFMSTLSNLMKKISQTQETLVDNLK